MDSLSIFIAKAKVFFSSYKWLLLPLVLIVIFVLIIFSFFAAPKTSTTNSTTTVNQQNTTSIPQSGGQNETFPSTEISVAPSDGEISQDQAMKSAIDQEISDIAYGKTKFSQDESDDQDAYPGNDEVEEGSIDNKTLPDGSIEYEYSSDDQNRPHIQIIKDNTVIFRRNLMPDTQLSDYSDYLNSPEYTSHGSSYFGSNATIYASPTKGVAVVADSQTGQVYEQYLFQVLSVSDYLKKYGRDISAYQP